jgi:hypothetical protein
VTTFFVFVKYFFVYSESDAHAEPGDIVDLLTLLDVISSKICALTPNLFESEIEQSSAWYSMYIDMEAERTCSPTF